jgi:hypothetical protein
MPCAIKLVATSTPHARRANRHQGGRSRKGALAAQTGHLRRRARPRQARELARCPVRLRDGRVQQTRRSLRDEIPVCREHYRFWTQPGAFVAAKVPAKRPPTKR